MGTVKFAARRTAAELLQPCRECRCLCSLGSPAGGGRHDADLADRRYSGSAAVASALTFPTGRRDGLMERRPGGLGRGLGGGRSFCGGRPGGAGVPAAAAAVR